LSTNDGSPAYSPAAAAESAVFNMQLLPGSSIIVGIWFVLRAFFQSGTMIRVFFDFKKYSQKNR
jgi:hypothetical protein